MIDHIGLPVSNYARSKKFYEKVLAPLGYRDAFYSAAFAAGAKDNGAPGPRPHYHPNYYGAFVIDPNGHNIEAICHQAP
jgi:predicted enzyme related to lactoylglutathione lyase